MIPDIDARSLATSLRRLEAQTEDREALVLERSLQQIMDVCVELFGVSGGGIMLVFEHADLRNVVVAGTGSRLLEESQAAVGQGPCVDAVVLDVEVTSSSVIADSRWPDLRRRLVDGDLEAVLAMPLRLGGTAVGSLNVACVGEHDWTHGQRSALRRYADLTESTLATAVSAEQSSALAAQLTYALEYRGSIERGVGYLMARDQLDRTDAFNRLRLATRRSRRRINDVAEGLLSSGRLPGERR